LLRHTLGAYNFAYRKHALWRNNLTQDETSRPQNRE
jgi:hypothetical protein